MMIGILDYGMGNLHSVCSALERLGEDWVLTDDHEKLNKTDGLILPGVGAFYDAMMRLKAKGHDNFLKKYAETKPLLGICLGMQLLFEAGEEHGQIEGLGLLKGKSVRFSGVDRLTGESYKVPHMGWNKLVHHKPDDPIINHRDEDYVYFVHAYVITEYEDSVLLASADYHGKVPAIAGADRVYGMQFHPEKSSKAGMAFLKNFCELAAMV